MEWDGPLLCLRAKLFKAFSHLNNVIELPSQWERWTVGLIPAPLCGRCGLGFMHTHVVTHGHSIDPGHLIARYDVAKKLGREIKHDVTWSIVLWKCLESKQKNIFLSSRASLHCRNCTVTYRPLRIMPAENCQNSVLFLVSFMHVWCVDKERVQNSRNCPPWDLYGSANFTAVRAESANFGALSAHP